MAHAFEVKCHVNDAAAPVVAHVPHSSTVIPADVWETLALDDGELRREIALLTDWHADELFDSVTNLGGTMLINSVSRIVADPERFRDDAKEEMATHGLGAIYVRTADGKLLRKEPLGFEERERLLGQFYDPYAAEFDRLVSKALDEFGRCLILDCHSFPTIPFPYEADQSTDRPDVCIGTDNFHTPALLATSLETAVSSLGLSVAVNHPFAGSYVPTRFYGRDQRVASVMIEIRRGLYCDEATGRKSDAFAPTRLMVASLVSAAVAGWHNSSSIHA